MLDINQPYFHREDSAVRHFEECVWPHGPVCPHCGNTKRLSKLKANPQKRIRRGLYLCPACCRQFTAKVGTLFESSHLPMRKILLAYYMLISDRKGVSALQIKRQLKVDYKTAWFLMHRIREGLRNDELPLFGSQGGAVEVDETSMGDCRTPQEKKTQPRKRGQAGQQKILSIIDRTTGLAKSFSMKHLSRNDILPLLQHHIAKEAHVMTDRAPYYQRLGEYFPHHSMVKHSAKEYVRRGNPVIHINTVEGSFAMLKRGRYGTYQDWSPQHSIRYVAEFQFRSNYHQLAKNNDLWLMDKALATAVGKRMAYHPSTVCSKSLVH